MAWTYLGNGCPWDMMVPPLPLPPQSALVKVQLPEWRTCGYTLAWTEDLIKSSDSEAPSLAGQKHLNYRGPHNHAPFSTNKLSAWTFLWTRYTYICF